MARKGYRSVNIPDETHHEITQLLKKKPQLGYVSVDDFVRSAVRNKMEECSPKRLVAEVPAR
jgi:Arc/MetJ-type ribon-helix-helix transcriptional regulator